MINNYNFRSSNTLLNIPLYDVSRQCGLSVLLSHCLTWVPGCVPRIKAMVDNFLSVNSLFGNLLLGNSSFLTHMQCNVSLCNGDSVRPAGRPAGVVKTLTLAISRLI